MELDPQHELHRKALDQVGHLLGSLEAGLISPHAFRVAIETIWNVLGGVVRLEAFEELMREANAHVATLPADVHTTILASNDDHVRIIMRSGTQVRLLACALKGSKVSPSTLDDVAAQKVKDITAQLHAQGMQEILP